ncbi:MAG: hypothetical protein HY298_14830 [Verrucomicrobia bacterium]|nr:hypothetical protein [Verrucomicrobiota bacterium]
MTSKLLTTLMTLALSAHVASCADAKVRKLIEFGWDEPDTAFIRQHLAEMERTPFDGCVFHVNYPKPDGQTGNFTWECWSHRAFRADELKTALADLKATPFRRFTHNFLRFNTTPADLDWFDDHSAVLTNARLAAGLARDGKCKGLLFDIEQYNAPLFNYRKQRQAATRTWNEYAAQVRQCGRETMNAFQEGYPGLTVFLTFGYCLPWAESQNGTKPLADCSYGLLAPFLDGMVEAAKGKTRLVDGYERSYGYKDTTRFAAAYEIMKTGVRPIVADEKKYHRVFSFGFGVWMDNDWRKLGWNADDPTKNFYSPEEFAASARKALEVADEYVWIYTETPRWWSPEGKSVKLPEAYDDALRRARNGLAKD